MRKVTVWPERLTDPGLATNGVLLGRVPFSTVRRWRLGGLAVDIRFILVDRVRSFEGDPSADVELRLLPSTLATQLLSDRCDALDTAEAAAVEEPVSPKSE